MPRYSPKLSGEGVCFQNVALNFMMMIYGIFVSIYDDFMNYKEENDQMEKYMKRHENLKCIEASDEIYLRDLRLEQETVAAVIEMKKLWPHHKWLVDNKI